MRNGLSVAIAGVLCLLQAFVQSSAHADEESSGQNTLNPVARFEVRHRFDSFVGKNDVNFGRFRFEEKISPPGDWQYGLRLDARFINADDDGSSGEFSDFFIEGRAIKRDGADRYGFGLRNVVRLPDDTAGGEKWDLAPIAGFSRDLDYFDSGSFVGILARYRFSVTGADSRADRNRLELIPSLNIHVGEYWFAEFISDTRLDFERGNTWDVPIGLRVGRDIGEQWVVSVEPRYFIVNDVRDADYSIETRVNYFFGR